MRRRGFSMIEVLIALAIFALAAVVLGAAYINVLNAYARATEVAQQQEDVRFARQAVFQQADREELEKGGDFQTTDGRRVSWQATVEPTNLPDLFEVRFICEVSGAPGSRPEAFEQRFRLLRPTWSEADEREKLRKEIHDRIVEFQSKIK
ncbi:MAG TPA: prepilin-type N-terminal cleavage/methylation domain-containing protein [Candidatus Synoicihabitans sp.]|nr:prepilin-type N-terminal cleavage/methylation domain-containing protein [Candidatus Synoicihabitans sp.]